MKDEIKEILDDLKHYSYCYDNYDKEKYNINRLLDYITNLQTIEQQYSSILSENAELENKITNLQEENKRLKEIVENLTTMTVCGDRKQIKNTAQYKLEIYKSRNEKARAKLQSMFDNGNEETILDDLLELDRILGEDKDVKD